MNSVHRAIIGTFQELPSLPCSLPQIGQDDVQPVQAFIHGFFNFSSDSFYQADKNSLLGLIGQLRRFQVQQPLQKSQSKDFHLIFALIDRMLKELQAYGAVEATCSLKAIQEGFQSNRKIVELAVHQNGLALVHGSRELQKSSTRRTFLERRKMIGSLAKCYTREFRNYSCLVSGPLQNRRCRAF